jgi:alanine racemase
MPTLSTFDEVTRWSARAKSLKVFLKLDGGSFRAGAFPQEAAAVARAIYDSGTLHLAGVYGHPLAYSEAKSPGFAKAQIESCILALSRIEAAGVRAPLRMISSSATILSYPEADLNAIDPGRLVVGHRFPAIADRERRWRHALVGLRSRLVMVKSLENPDVIMPAPYFALRPNMRLGLIPFGWGDGYPRILPQRATALVRGRRVPLLGPPHSELMRVDLTDVPEAEIGDEVVLLGRSGGEHISLHDLAAQWQVDVLDLYLAVGKSVRRVYVR